jgi:hypothetical protein
MFARRHTRLLLQREELRLRSATLRVQMVQDAARLAAPLSWLDSARAGAHWLREHPQWPLAGAALLVVLRPRRVLRWAGTAWWGWRALRPALPLLRAWLRPSR